jgi:hypothetical protein
MAEKLLELDPPLVQLPLVEVGVVPRRASRMALGRVHLQAPLVAVRLLMGVTHRFAPLVAISSFPRAYHVITE